MAEEISKLADNSIASAGEIGKIIKNSVERINSASNQMVDTSRALNDIIFILESNRAFLEEFVNLVVSQDKDVQVLVNHLEDFIEYTQSIDELAGESTEGVSQSQSMVNSVEIFYSDLSNMSDNLIELSNNLSLHIGALQDTLSKS